MPSRSSRFHLPFSFRPAKAGAALGHLGPLARPHPTSGISSRRSSTSFIAGIRRLARSSWPGRYSLPSRFGQFHQEGRIGVLALRSRGSTETCFSMVKLFQQDVIDRHPPGAVLPGVDGDPLVGVLRDLAEVRTRRPTSSSRCGEPRRRSGSRACGSCSDVRAHHRQELGVVPVGRLGERRSARPRSRATPAADRSTSRRR